MKPYQLNNTWIINNTYNGNIKNIHINTQLLKKLPTKHRIYVTPNLINQNANSVKIHKKINQLIATPQPNMIILIKHSIMPHIQKGLETSGFNNKLLIETNPLNFYTNINLFIATKNIILI